MNLISLTITLSGQVQMIEHLYYVVSDKNIQYNTSKKWVNIKNTLH